MKEIISNMKNEYGEPYSLKIDDGIVYINHSDFTKGYISLLDALSRYILNKQEINY